VAGSLVFASAAAEVALRWAAPIYTAGNQRAYKYDPVLGVRLRESLRLYRRTDHLDEIFSNRYGTANANDDFTGYAGLIFALGDSYTQGTGLPADQSYPAQLELMLNEDSSGLYHKRLAVVNLGLAAYGGEQSLLVLDRYARMLKNPTACLYLGSENDFDDDLLFKGGARHHHIVYGSPRYGALTPALIWLGNLQLVLRVKLAVASRRTAAFRSRVTRDEPASPTTFIAPDSSRKLAAPGAKSVAELEWPVIQKLIEACRARGAPTVVGWSGLPAASGSYEWLRSKAAADSLSFNDWYRRVESVRAAVPALPIANPHSGGHYRGWVAREIAAGFRDQLLRVMEVPSVKARSAQRQAIISLPQ
jgi:hypothetical protein